MLECRVSMLGEDAYPVPAPGWAAIDRALASVHSGRVPHQFSSSNAYELESRNPLPAIGVYEGTVPDHWHYVTYGLTELFEKSSPRPDVSGFGFELTLRLPRAPHEDMPPVWGLTLLQTVGHYVLAGGGALEPGDLIGLPTPLGPGLGLGSSAPEAEPLHAVVCV